MNTIIIPDKADNWPYGNGFQLSPGRWFKECVGGFGMTADPDLVRVRTVPPSSESMWKVLGDREFFKKKGRKCRRYRGRHKTTRPRPNMGTRYVQR